MKTQFLRHMQQTQEDIQPTWNEKSLAPASGRLSVDWAMCITDGVDGTTLEHDTMTLRFIYCILCKSSNIKAK